ncbi:efflux RND transporter periplasmic adaptor subunit [Acinetobacter baumannii]|nr:efflux RND transporter periplasmic adaptor subunit [Acinetobacter baumannii]
MTSAPVPLNESPKKNNTTHRIRYVVFGLIGILAMALLIYCNRNKEDHPADRSSTTVPALTVTSSTPQKVTWPLTLNAEGVITAWEEASISARISGYQLVDVLVNVGDSVKKGQVLARFDRTLLLAEQAELLAKADQAKENQQRMLSLRDSHAISKQEVSDAITESKVANALLEKNQLQLRYTNVVAPDDGIISARAATLGSTVPIGQELFKMIRQNRLEWRGELTAVQRSQVKIGQAIILQLPNGSTATAIVRQISPSFDSESRLAMIYADIQPNNQIHAGMYVTGSIKLGDSLALTVPAKSVIIRDGYDYVLVLSENKNISKVSLRKVTVGRRQGQAIEITDGLNGSEHIVVDGAGFLSDGDVVRVAQRSGVTES